MNSGCPPTEAAETTTVAIYATDPLTELGVESILGGDGRLKVLPDADFTLAKVIVVVEEFIDEGAFAFMRDVRASSQLKSPPRCVIVTDHFRADVLMRAIECGMSATLPRCNTTGEDLVRTILAVSDGSASLPARLQGNLLTELERMRRDVLEPNGFTLSGLSERERDVLRLLADGRDTEEIAAELPYSESTVKNILYGVMTRYNLNTRAQADLIHQAVPRIPFGGRGG